MATPNNVTIEINGIEANLSKVCPFTMVEWDEVADAGYHVVNPDEGFSVEEFREQSFILVKYVIQKANSEVTEEMLKGLTFKEVGYLAQVITILNSPEPGDRDFLKLSTSLQNIMDGAKKKSGNSQ